MAITTLSTVKSLLNITDTSRDTWITALIPVVESDYESIRNKPFDTCAKLTIDTGASADGDITITISDASTDLECDIAVKNGDTPMLVAQRVENYFNRRNIRADGNDVLFIGSGVVLTFDGGATGVTETITGMATIYPSNAELTVANMINYHLQGAVGKVSESLGDHSITYDRGVGAYPNEIVSKIKSYAVMS